jgi:two-component system response regulator RegA
MKDYKAILIAEDDLDLRESLERSFTRRGFDVKAATSVKEALEIIRNFHPRFAVIDLKIGNDSGLKLVEELNNFDKNIKIVVLTGYASITTTIEAIKLGACYYLAKPANVDDIILAFEGKTGGEKIQQNKKTSLRNLEMEHIHKVLAEVDFNISKAARILGMHRRTLARKLEKKNIPN